MLTKGNSDPHVRGLLHTCLDETGKWKDPTVSFAGWISDSPRWHAFSQEWFALLEEFPGVRGIHMSDLMMRGGEVKYQEHVFSEDPTREKLVNKCVDVINKHTLAVVACGVDCNAYRRLLSCPSRKQIGKDAHVFVFRRVMKHIADTLNTIQWPYATGLIFHDNREYGKECYEHYSNSREMNSSWRKVFGSISFADDELYPPLQAADMLAWFLRKKNEQSYDGKFDKTIKRLLKGKPAEAHYYDESSLRELDVKLETGRVP